MLKLILSAAILTAGSAQAQFYGQCIGNYCSGSSSHNGYRIDYNTNRIGNTRFDNYRDNRGNRLRCTSDQIGSYTHTHCY